MNVQHLAEYLNNHLAGSVGGIEVTKRCLSNSRGTDLGLFLEKLLAELEEDQSVIKKVISVLGMSEDTLKKLGTWALVKFAEPKLASYEGKDRNLGRLVEVEAILLGSRGRLAMWKILEQLAPHDVRMSGFGFSGLTARTEEQIRQLEDFRLQAARAAFF